MYIQSLESFSDERGDLYPLDFERVPFHPKRLFVVSNVPKNEIRGEHAHYQTHQFLICLQGEIEVVLFDGEEVSTVTLRPFEGVHIPNLVWDYQKFKTGEDILLVLASTNYDREDYIESLAVYKRMRKCDE